MPLEETDMKEKNDDSLRFRKESNNENGKSKGQNNAEYFQALEQWLKDARSYRDSCNIFAGLSYAAMAQQMNGIPSQNESVNTFVPPVPPINGGLGLFNMPSFRQQPQQQHSQRQEQQQLPAEEGVEYTIPPFWKRFIAELVDFVLLFMIKLAITFIAVDFFDFVEIEKVETIQLQDKMDYKIAIEITSEIIFLEFLYRFIVCLYEGIFLRKGVPNQRGGATPGKIFMGIKVVLCNSVQEVENRPNVVKVYPATDLGFGWSFVRALLKNLVLALLIPIYFPFFLNKYNRTTYDILSHSVVVEDGTNE